MWVNEAGGEGIDRLDRASVKVVDVTHGGRESSGRAALVSYVLRATEVHEKHDEFQKRCSRSGDVGRRGASTNDTRQ